jgi:PiT family inorganic phosphate transporter
MYLGLVVVLIAIALSFDYTNGFHDAANAIATSVSTRALTPRIALLMAAFFNFVGAFLGQGVANTIASITSPQAGNVGLVMIIAALLGAIAWNLITWWLGLPSSSSQALIGGIVGASLAAATTVKWNVVVEKVIIPMILSPIVGFLLAYALMLGILWGFRNRNPNRTQRGFRIAQVGSAAAMSLGHGLQDAQKTMGIITLALITGGYLPANTTTIPVWVVASSAAAISLGTYAGGWRIMRTLGRRIIHLDPARGFAAESVAASLLFITAFVFKAPISTTQTITGSIMGVGATKRLSAVRWGVGVNIAWAWVLTLPMSALIAAASFYILRPILT